MGIVLKKKNKNIVLDNTDKVFDGTEFEDEEFSITLKAIGRTERLNMLSSFVDENGKILQGYYAEEMFIKSIVAVDGFVDEEGKELSVEDGVAEVIWNECQEFFVDAIREKIKSIQGSEEKKMNNPEQDSQATQIGQQTMQ